MDKATTAYEKTYRAISEDLRSGNNVLLMGPGGCGKSYTIQRLYYESKQRGVVVNLTALTGIAAFNIGGSTLHRFAGLGVQELPLPVLINKIRKYSSNIKRWNKCRILIIDEISMMGRKLLEKVDYIARKIRYIDKPFGGIQLVLVGDLLQLPPVNDEWCFKSPLWKDLRLKVHHLTTPFRYRDTTFFDLLCRIRMGKPSEEDLSILTERHRVYFDADFDKMTIKPTILFSTKVNVRDHNTRELAKLSGKSIVVQAEDRLVKGNGDLNHHKTVFDGSVPERVELKVGAQVMLIFNLDVENGLMNGSRGVVTRILGADTVEVEFRSGRKTIKPIIWEHETEEIKVSRRQLPLVLAYSMTIHKSQSSSLDCCVMDLGDSIFAPGMAYVALSRVRSLEGLYISDFAPKSIISDKEALSFTQALI